MRCKQGSLHLQIHDGTAVAKTYVNKTAKTIGTDHQCFERNYLTKLKEGQHNNRQIGTSLPKAVTKIKRHELPCCYSVLSCLCKRHVFNKKIK